PDQSAGPLFKRPDVRWGFANFQRPGIWTIDNPSRAIVNSAGEPFDPPVEIDDSRLVLTLVRNEPAFAPLTSLLYKDAINSDTFLGAAPGLAKIAMLSSVRR